MDRMTIVERDQYLRRRAPRYGPAARSGQSRLLDEMAAMTGRHRKSRLRLLRPDGLVRHPRTPQRGRADGAAVDDAVRVIGESWDDVCAERLTPGLGPTARLLAHQGELARPPELETPLGQMSRATVQRHLPRRAQDTPRLPRRGPAAAHRVARARPLRRIPWDEREPGPCEVALVHHRGPSTAGEYLPTLQRIDVATGGSERVAVLGRSYRHLAAGFEQLLARLPFAVREFHPDTGAAVLNDHRVRFWGDRVPGLTRSRSRPYHKNDHRFVEPKTATLGRAYFGTARLDTAAPGAALQALYEPLWRSSHRFQPVRHLVEKTAQGTRVRRRWDTAQTPYERVAATPALPVAQRTVLDALYQATNPRALRRARYARLEARRLPRPAAAEPAAGGGRARGAPRLPEPTAARSPTGGSAHAERRQEVSGWNPRPARRAPLPSGTVRVTAPSAPPPRPSGARGVPPRWRRAAPATAPRPASSAPTGAAPPPPQGTGRRSRPNYSGWARAWPTRWTRARPAAPAIWGSSAVPTAPAAAAPAVSAAPAPMVTSGS